MLVLARDEVEPARSYEAAVAGSQVVCATTFAREPVVRRDWLAPGTHVTSVGYNPNGRELDDATIMDSLLCVESRQAALSATPPNRDLSEPLDHGLITLDDPPVEVGELVDGTRRGRTSPDQLTLYKGVGVALEDATAAGLVLAAARKHGRGTEIVFS